MNRDKWTESPPAHCAVPLRNPSFSNIFPTNLHRLKPQFGIRKPNSVWSLTADTAANGCQIGGFSSVVARLIVFVPSWKRCKYSFMKYGFYKSSYSVYIILISNNVPMYIGGCCMCHQYLVCSNSLSFIVQFPCIVCSHLSFKYPDGALQFPIKCSEHPWIVCALSGHHLDYVKQVKRLQLNVNRRPFCFRWWSNITEQLVL